MEMRVGHWGVVEVECTEAAGVKLAADLKGKTDYIPESVVIAWLVGRVRFVNGNAGANPVTLIVTAEDVWHSTE